ncbi:MAG TPA: hypothetical protein VNK41_09630 [Vicinamibacterales bacterium]|nr:hypothetical protein [Vicinamibacterales bacterium]
MTRSSQHVAAAVAVFGLLGFSGVQLGAQDKPRLVAPFKGTARVEITKPVTRVVGSEIVSTLLLKNLEAKPIAGLKVEEHWYTPDGQPYGSNVYRHRRPLQPQEVIKIEFRMKRSPQQSRNRFTFSHINGDIKQTVVPKLELPPAPKPAS